MRRNATLFLLLCSMFLLGTAKNVTAQDILEFKVDPNDGICCWNFTVKNRSLSAITKVELTFTNIGTIEFEGALGPDAWGEPAYDQSNRRITYELVGGTPIQPGEDKPGFYFCHSGYSPADIEKPVRITWKTFNLTTQLSSSTAEFVCTDFQTLTRLDTVSQTATKVGTDPLYNFTVMNRNAPSNAAIGKMIFELTTITAGTIRPKLVEAPAGWILDSVTAYRAYFSTFQAAIQPGANLGGFKVGLRSNANAKNVTWVWRAQTVDGISIDRDTLRNVINNADNGALSNDEVTMTKQTGCLYNMSVSNFHAMNLQPPAKITMVRVVSKTPGVTFSAAPTKPAGWGASIKSVSKDTIFYASSGEANAIPSGITFSDFAFSVDNPAGSTFNVEWQTLRNNVIISSASVLLECVVEPPRSDAASITKNNENCFFKIEVINQHNTPASSLGAIAISIPANSGTLTSGATNRNWELVSSNATSLLYRAPTTAENLPNGETQTINFTMVPKNAQAPVAITWSTYETVGGPVISTGSEDESCAPIVEQRCDSIYTEVQTQESCLQRILVFNQRFGDETVNSVTITPMNGWTVDTAYNLIGWQRTVGTNGASVAYTGSLPSGVAVPATFRVGFKAAIGTPDDFTATVSTAGTDNLTCDTILAFNCTPGEPQKSVTSRLQNLMTMSVSPNPANLASSIGYYLPEQSRVSIAVIDVLGNNQQSIFSGMLSEGKHQAQVDASALANGTYYVRIETSYGTITKQLIINR